jgi:hypothetical protein
MKESPCRQEGYKEATRENGYSEEISHYKGAFAKGTNGKRLFSAQAVDWIHHSRPDRLVADGQQGDQQRTKTVKSLSGHNLGQPPVIFVVIIERQLIPNPKSDQKGDCYPDRKAKGVDERIPLAAEEVAPGDREIIF